jgi:tRNA dimethylallyltransferase
LIDFVAPDVNYTAGEWAREATLKIEEIEERGASALLVGGTGFYLRAIRVPFFPSPPTDDKLRKRITAIKERHGAVHLHKLLTRIDPQTAATLFERDWPRVQRALEVRLQTGLPLSAQKNARALPHESVARIRVFVLNPPRDELYRRIDSRTDSHFSAGLVDEVRGLLEKGVPAESNALGAHGYRRVVEHLRGARDLNSAIAQTKLDIRHYSKRQLTWFRREQGVEWVEGFGDDESVQSRVLDAVVRLE